MVQLVQHGTCVPLERLTLLTSRDIRQIDWLHDQCKEDYRQQQLRERPGLWGRVAHQWDRFQGWIAITLTGFFTAVIAFGIISLEMWLFDIKDGYCTTAWWRAKRFCRCDITPAESRILSLTSPVLRSALAHTSFIQAWAKPKKDPLCDAWQEWSNVLDGQGSTFVRWLLEYGIYIAMAVSRPVLPGHS